MRASGPRTCRSVNDHRSARIAGVAGGSGSGIRRDWDERDTTNEDILERYLTTVRPMHGKFIEPSKRHAEVIGPQGGRRVVAIATLVATIHRRVSVRMGA
jgi:uridine kinase